MVSLEEGLSRGNKGADAIKQAINHMSAFMANVRICRSIFQAAPAVGWLLLSWAIPGLCKQRSGSRSDTLQTILGLGSQQLD